MVVQIVIGTGVILFSLIIAGLAFWSIETGVSRASPWLVKKPSTPKLMAVLLATAFVLLLVMTATVWIWALILLRLEVFVQQEAAVYFSIVAFTTLGFGDILLPSEWRILGGMTAANGLLNMGLYTAVLVEALRRVRSEQIRGIPDEH